MRLPNLLLAPGAIYPRYVPVSQQISSVRKLIHSLSCDADELRTHELNWQQP